LNSGLVQPNDTNNHPTEKKQMNQSIAPKYKKQTASEQIKPTNKSENPNERKQKRKRTEREDEEDDIDNITSMRV
jgi:hypothetical protein